jgi:EmrB/QacA subfamily drug resistance transporter
VATVCMGAFMGQLDASIVTLALPTLQRTFHASLGAVTWVGLGYLLVLVAMVTAVGRVADMAGRKLLYTYGFGVFILGSALCGLAPSLAALVGFRVLQAVGAAMLQANSVAIIYLALPRASLGRGIGIQGAAQALGLALGPAAGGLLLAAGGWRLIFLINVPLGLAGLAAGWLLIPRSRHLQQRAPFDWAGLALFIPAVGALLSAATLGNRAGWTSPVITSMLAGAVVLGTGFVRWERRARAPMLDISLFRSPAFASGIASGLLSYLVMFGVLLVVPFYLERALRVSTGRAGLVLTVMPVCLAVVAPLAGRLADRYGPGLLTATGMAVVAATLIALALSRPGQWALLSGLAVAGAGLGLFTPPNNAAIMAAAPKRQSGMAGGVLNMTRGTGTALGLALTAAAYELGGSPRQGFRIAVLFLATMAAAAAWLASRRGHGPAEPASPAAGQSRPGGGSGGAGRPGRDGQDGPAPPRAPRLSPISKPTAMASQATGYTIYPGRQPEATTGGRAS